MVFFNLSQIFKPFGRPVNVGDQSKLSGGGEFQPHFQLLVPGNVRIVIGRQGVAQVRVAVKLREAHLFLHIAQSTFVPPSTSALKFK